MAARVTRTTKPASSAPEPAAPEPDDVPTFTTKPVKVKYDGPVLMRIDGVDYRMRSDRSFAGSLRYLRKVRTRGVRDAEFALLDHLAGSEATDKLLEVAELDPGKWTQVVKRATDHVLGKIG